MAVPEQPAWAAAERLASAATLRDRAPQRAGLALAAVRVDNRVGDFGKAVPAGDG